MQATVAGFFMLAAFSLVLLFQCLAAAYCNRTDPAPGASVREVLRAWLTETWTALKVFLWWQPFRSTRYPDHLSAGTGRGIVFVHGFLCNRGIWNAWYPELDRRRIPYLAINLEPVIASIDTYGDSIEHAVQRMQTATGLPPLLICHSMGGLAVRAWFRARHADAQVHRVVTIGSPHHGTRIGTWTPQVPAIANAHQMRFGADWIGQLAQQETPDRRSKFVCYYSNCDNIVFPASCGALPGADNRHIGGLPHLAMAMDTRIMAQSLAMM